MELDPRNKLFNKVIELIDDVDLEYFSLGSFTKEKAEEILKKLEDSKSPEEDIFEILSYYDDEYFEIEDDSTIQVVDVTTTRYGLSDIPPNASNTVKCIAYLNDLIQKLIEGEVITTSAVSLLKDGRSSIWIPNGFDHDMVDKLFDPIIDELKLYRPELELN